MESGHAVDVVEGLGGEGAVGVGSGIGGEEEDVGLAAGEDILDAEGAHHPDGGPEIGADEALPAGVGFLRRG